MAQLSSRTTLQITNLPTGWSTKDQLIQLMLADQTVVNSWHEFITDQVSQPIEPQPLTIDNWSKKLFWPTSWQLTLPGFTFMCQTYTSFYTHKNSSNYKANGRVLVNLNRLINGPWYLQNGLVAVWDQFVNFELEMVNGNVHEYINFRVPK